MSGAGRPEPLEHRQERGLTGIAEHLDAPAQRVLGAERHDELVLQEAPGTVDAVPLRHGVQGVEERRDALNLALALSWGHAIPRLVEGSYGCPVRQATRKDRGRDRQLPGSE